MTNGTTALVIMSRERRLPILGNLESLKIHVLTVGNCRQARSLLQTRRRLESVTTNLSLSDGNLCDIFKILVDWGISTSAMGLLLPLIEPQQPR